ncbi:alcohol dehydrogenase catalytic domain-containing protein [Tessaracoccus sp. SD287]|uniref:zinc-binding dehydrogenase n=1 Tax=Tessaracoccus sp. SD287 TaxID=2782008 RepID=UPI001A961E84|nr:alcohol dehydrogenase catalytic domain-containing protein [Tessaracoccus sp. SD287]MBO1030804.1 alcohol dehydrogenase catalytic domain-containing protein [Tessaracoccus sp. SD287]
MLAYEYQSDGVLRLVERADPVAAAGEVVVQVAASGICGTDLKIARGQHRLYPAGTVRIPGHEAVGVITQNRSGQDLFAPGTRVAIAPNIACTRCRPCRRGLGNLCENYQSVGLTFDGGFAEQVLIPAAGVAAGNVMVVPDGLDMAVASLVEPIAAVVRGLRPLTLGSDDTLLVCGAGPIGLIALLVARHRGVGRVIVSQTSPHRRGIAEHLGADATLDPREGDLAHQVRDLTDGAGADAIVVATPVAQVFADAVRSAAKGGRINFFAGLPTGQGVVGLDANLVHYGELVLTGSTANTNADCREALDLLTEVPEVFAPLISARFPLEQADQAFAAATSGDNLKVLVTPRTPLPA